MARRGKSPDVEMAGLHAKRVELASRRHEASAAQGAAERVVASAADRRRAVLLAEARGQEHTETVEQVDLDRRTAEVAVAYGRERADLLRTVEKDIEEEVEALIDAHPEHYIAAAEAASEAAAGAIAAAKTAAQAAAMAWQEAAGAWGTVWQSRRRRGLETPPRVSISDFGNAVGEFERSHLRPFPGGSREAWERWRAQDGAPKVRVSNAEALARFGGEAA
jgi:hypothetical protein